MKCDGKERRVAMRFISASRRRRLNRRRSDRTGRCFVVLAMQTGTFEKLSGQVEVDETYIGGLSRFMHKSVREARIRGRAGYGKAIVMGILERHGEVRTKVILDGTRDSLQPEVR